MTGLTVHQSGSFDNLESYLEHMGGYNWGPFLSKYGEMGVAALSNATPTDTGLTAHSWYYEISESPGFSILSWYNSHEDRQGDPIVFLLEYGHGTRTGGYVPPREFIMFAIRPIFDAIEKDINRILAKG